MPHLSIHLMHFLEIVAALVAAPAAGFYTWRGIRRRREEQRQLRAPKR